MDIAIKISIFICFTIFVFGNCEQQSELMVKSDPDGSDNDSDVDAANAVYLPPELGGGIAYLDPKNGQLKSLASCFSIDSSVETPIGFKTLRDLMPGDKVLTVSDSGSLRYESVIVDVHHLPHLHTNFYKIQTEANEIMVTSKHYLYVGVSVDESELITSDDVVIGDSLLVYNNSALAAEKVVNMELVSASGISNPIVSSGRILVNHVLASVYSEAPPFSPTLSHGLVWPFRMFYKYNINIYGGETFGMPHVAFYGNMMREKLA